MAAIWGEKQSATDIEISNPQQQTTEHDSVNFLRVSEEQQLGMRIVELTNTSMLAVFLLCRFLITFGSQV